jgi:anti-sigma factor RsiW
MTKLHLSDYDLQLAAEGAPLPEVAATHLPSCPRCQARLAAYQQLFAATASLPPPAFEFDLAAAVLAQLPQPKPAFPWVLVLVGGLVLAVVMAFLTLFGGLLVPVLQSLSTGLGAGVALVIGFIVAGQSLELLAQHRRQMRQLTFS